MNDYQLKYNAKKDGQQGESHTIEIKEMPNLGAAMTEARGKLFEVQCQDSSRPFNIGITSAMVRRQPAGRWHRV